MNTSYQNHPAHTSQKFAPRPDAPALFTAAPTRTTTASAAEIRRAVAILSMAPPQPGDIAALLQDLAEQFGVPVHVVVGLVVWRRLGDGG